MTHGDSKPVLALTGATGFVGSHVLRAALRRGWKVRALVRDPARLTTAHPELAVITGDLDDRDALRHLLEGADAAIHLAGLVAAARRGDFTRVNVNGAANVARAAARAGTARLVHVSSLAARHAGLSPYAASKRASEEAVRDGAASRVSLVTIRPPAVYGPGDRATLGLFDQLTRRRALLPGRRESRFSLIHAADLAEALLELAETGAAAGEVLEIDDGKPGGYSWRELAAIASRELGRPLSLLMLPRPLVKAAGLAADAASALSGRAFMLSSAKANELYHPDWVARPPLVGEKTGWTARLDFAQGFRDTLQWYCQHGWLPRTRLPENDR